MRAIMVMFDSLNRDALSAYDSRTSVPTPHFDRLAAHSVRFDACYVGSLPCMPARRELHTGRYNFLHRSWGPLEPFDDSVPEMLGNHGVTTHLATDHMHYWEDGGATYHTRYGSFSLIRGQQGDPLHGMVADPEPIDSLRIRRSGTWRQDRINRAFRQGLQDHPQVMTFDAGLEFIDRNAGEDKWFVQIETFDPHEPFDSGDRSGTDSSEVDVDWPDYGRATFSADYAPQIIDSYERLVALCDTQLGRVLDMMDEKDLWSSTLLIVCTDHGFLLGENMWWGKTVMPWFEKVARTPLFIWDPRSGKKGSTTNEIVQTIDIGPTILDFFGVEPTPDMLGESLFKVLSGSSLRDDALFGSFGSHVCISDGRFVYMRGPANASNQPLFEHTLMPTHMRGMFAPEELRDAELVAPFSFTKGVPLMRVKASVAPNPDIYGTLLFDLDSDPQQSRPLVNDAEELRMLSRLRDLLVQCDAPASQFERLGIPREGSITQSHLRCASDERRGRPGFDDPPALETYPENRFGAHSRVGEVIADPEAAHIFYDACGPHRIGPFGDIATEVTLYRAAYALFGANPWQKFDELVTRLGDLNSSVEVGRGEGAH